MSCWPATAGWLSSRAFGSWHCPRLTFPDWDVHTFRDLVVWKADDPIDHLRETLQDFVQAPEALSFGEDFMLLSSAKFELSPAEASPVEIDVTQRVGLDLILPVASLLPLERRVQWSERVQIPLKVLENLADGAETLALLLAGGRIDRLVAKLPRVGPLVSKAAIPTLLAAAKMSQSKLEQVNKEARANHDYLTAMLTQFKLDLDQGVTDGLLIKKVS